MASVINTNNASLVAQRNLASSQTNLTTSVQRLSSGLRINSAKDDAAGLGISQKLQAQITGANVSARNANDAISMVQTAEGGMQEVSSMLQRMRELATQGNNDSLDDTQRGYIATEIDALRSEINQVATRTTFNGKTLLDGSISGVAAVGTAASSNYVAATSGSATLASQTYVAGDSITVTIDGGTALTPILMTGTTATQAAADLNAVTAFSDDAVASVDSTSGDLVITSRATGTTSDISIAYTDQASTPVTTTTAGTAGAAVVGTAASNDYTAAVAGDGLQFQLGTTSADDTNDIGSLFQNVNVDSAGNFSALDTLITTVSTSGTETSANFGLLTAEIDVAIATIAGYRSDLGAMSNRLDHNIANLGAQSENLTASMSRIMDTDYAAETATLSKNQVMQQAATAMLAQANQMPNAVLSLLK